MLTTSHLAGLGFGPTAAALSVKSQTNAGLRESIAAASSRNGDGGFFDQFAELFKAGAKTYTDLQSAKAQQAAAAAKTTHALSSARAVDAYARSADKARTVRTVALVVGALAVVGVGVALARRRGR